MTMQVGWTTSSKESYCSIYNLLNERESFCNPPHTYTHTFHYISAFQDIGDAHSGTFSNDIVVLQFQFEANSNKYKEGKKI